MKRRLVQQLEQGGNTFGQVSNPNDLLKAQQFAAEHVSGLTNDFVNKTRDFEVQGFSWELDNSNELELTINRPGRVYSKAGVAYDQLDDVDLTFSAAHSTLPRLDLVVARLDDSVSAEHDLIPFARLRTVEEFEDDVPPYPPQNINAATELHWRAVPIVKTGTPAAVPAIPAYASNAVEVPLYLVSIGPGVTRLLAPEIIDLRGVAWDIRELNDLVGQNRLDIQNLLRRMTRVEEVAGQTVDLGPVYGQIRTLGEILADLLDRTTAANDMPEIRYDLPKYALTDPRSSQIIAVGGNEGSTPVVDIDIGARVNFGDREVVIHPRNFADQSVNPRFHVTNNSEHETRDVDLTLGSVTQIGTNGVIDFVERSASISPARTRAAAAARDGRYIEIFGGLAANNASALGDWKTYDLQNDTMTSRTPGTALPSCRRPAMFPYGDGTHVLIICGDDGTDTPACYKLNASTGAVTAIGGTKPTGVMFLGDLVATGKIVVTATNADNETEVWEFTTSTNLFSLLGTTGEVPVPKVDYAGACFRGEANKLVMQTFEPNVSSSGRTYIFDRTTLQWIEYQIPQPFIDGYAKQLAIRGFRMACVNGRPLIVGGGLFKESEKELARVWELTVPPQTVGGELRPFIHTLAWREFDATFGRTDFPSFCSTLGGDSLPNAKAFQFGGYDTQRTASTNIFASVATGLISTVLNGVEGISIGPGTNSAQFEVPAYEGDFEAVAYIASLHGRFTAANVKIEVSLDGGDNWFDAVPDRTLSIFSSNPFDRRVRITLFSSPSDPPILTTLTETFDSDVGQAEAKTVIRYNPPNAIKALCIDRDGVVTLIAEGDITPSTPQRAIIHKVSGYELGSPPVVKNYINRRRAHVKYSKTKSGSGASTQFANELAVPARFVTAYVHRAADNLMYKIAEPAIAFDEDAINVTGVVTNGDIWYVEVEG